MNRFYFVILVLTIPILACKKDKKDEVNPFDDPSLLPPIEIGDTTKLQKGSFAYLHHFIFKPTCSNSGCHDGTFEPDFRTLSSAYNTMVYHEVIQNDDAGTYKYRVEPGNSSNSLLYVRLTSSIPVNASGRMPLSLEPTSDWFDKKNEYIEMIKQWIDDGAKDPFGNLPNLGNPEPEVKGILAFETGNTTNPLPRVSGQGVTPIGITNKKSIDIWIAVSDDKTPVNSLTGNKLKVSTSLLEFENADEYVLSTPAPISGPDFEGNSIDYTHMTTLDFSQDSIGSYFYLRTYFKDDDHEMETEIPNSGSSELMKYRFTLTVDSL